MGDTLFLYLKFCRLTGDLGLSDVCKQIFMAARFHAQDEMQVVALEFGQMRRIGAQGIFNNDKGQTGIILT